MPDFETSAALSIEVPRSELRDARREIESELGDVSVGLEASGGRGGAGSMMLDDVADDTSSLVRSADERNDLLRELVDQLQLDAGGGGGGGGGGDGGLPAASGGAAGSILGRLLPGTIGAGGGAAALGGGAAGLGLFGLELAARRLPGRAARNRENISQTLPEPIRSFAPTGLGGVAATQQQLTGRSTVAGGSLGGPLAAGASIAGGAARAGIFGNGLGQDIQTGADFLNFLAFGGGGPPEGINRDTGRLQRVRQVGGGVDTGPGTLDTNPAAPGVGGAGPPGDPFGAFDIRQGRSGAGGRAAGRSAVDVTIDVAGITGEPVQEAVQRAVQQNRDQIAADVQRSVEQKLSRESGGFAVSGPGGRF